MVGEVLRAERERRQLTIHDIEEATSIRALYIESIENGNYDKLPGDVYTKGFIKNYATFLNLDAESLVKQFVEERTPEPTSEEIISDDKNISNKKVEKPQEVPTEKIDPPKLRRRRNDSDSGKVSSGLIAAVILIAAIAGGAWYFFTNTDGEIADGDNKPKIEQPAQGNENQQPGQTQTPGAVAAAPNQSGVNIQAKFNGECWTEVTVDGMIVYEDVASAGQTLSWSGKDNVIVRVGNAGAVELTENGKPVGQLGAIGDVVERTFRRNQ